MEYFTCVYVCLSCVVNQKNPQSGQRCVGLLLSFSGDRESITGFTFTSVLHISFPLAQISDRYRLKESPPKDENKVE